MPEWLRRLLMGTTALYAIDDDGGGGDPPEDQDDGGDQDDGDPPEDELEEFDDQDDDQGQEQRTAQPTRGNRQFGELRERNRTLAQQLEDERQARIRAEERALAREQREHSETERARVAAMEPWEREQYNRDQRDRQRDGEMAQLRFQTWDNGDRAAFRDACRDVPEFGKIRDKVEDEFQKILKSGQNPTPREVIAQFLIGKAAVDKLRKGSGKRTERAAADSQRRQAANPGSSRSAGNGRSAGDTGGKTEAQKRFDRIKDISI